MTGIEISMLYLLCAFVQAVLTARYMEEKESPGLLVLGFTVFAPIVTLGWALYTLQGSVRWLVTGSFR